MAVINIGLGSKLIKSNLLKFGLNRNPILLNAPSRFYCERHIVHKSIFLKRHSLKILEERNKLYGIEPPEPREKIKFEEVNVDWKYVANLIPPDLVPEFPKFAKYPSGWQPPDYELIPHLNENLKAPDINLKRFVEKTKNLPYHVRRTRTRNVPVYFQSLNGNTRHITKVGYIEGDIWTLASELKNHLEEISGVEVPIQIHEQANYIRFRGDYFREITFWLMDKGF